MGVSVDDVGRNAAMVAKLRLPFPLLADPGGDGAIKPYGLWHAEEHGGVAHPAVVVVDPSGEETYRVVGRDFADRPPEDEVVDAVTRLGLAPTSQPAPAPGDPRPGERAMPLDALPAYFRGARFAAVAFSRRFPETRDEAERYVAEADRYSAAVRQLRKG